MPQASSSTYHAPRTGYATGEQVITPPPSPKASSTVLPAGDAAFFGRLMPLNVNTPHGKKLYFSRTMTSYNIGTRNDMDCVIYVPVIGGHFCTLVWDGTDNENAVQIVCFAEHENWGSGLYLNGRRLGVGEYVTLRHGDYVEFGTVCMGDPNEDLRFAWLRCTTRDGWLAHNIQPNAWIGGHDPDCRNYECEKCMAAEFSGEPTEEDYEEVARLYPDLAPFLRQPGDRPHRVPAQQGRRIRWLRW